MTANDGVSDTGLLLNPDLTKTRTVQTKDHEAFTNQKEADTTAPTQVTLWNACAEDFEMKLSLAGATK
eukprot:3767514-Karenia_brevis.AAC.1